MRSNTSPPSLTPDNAPRSVREAGRAHNRAPQPTPWKQSIIDRAGSGTVQVGPEDRPRFAAELPQIALDHLARLREVSEGSNALVRDITDRRFEAQQAKQRAEARIRQLSATRIVTKGHPSLIAVENEMAEAAKIYEELGERYNRYAAQAASARRLLHNVETFAASLPSGPVAAFEGEVPRLTEAEFAQEYADLDAEESRTRAAPPHSAAVLAHYNRLIDALVEQGRHHIEASIVGTFSGAPGGLLPTLDIRGEVSGFAQVDGAPLIHGFTTARVADAAPLLAFLAEDVLRDRLADLVARLADDENALEPAARAAKLADIAARRLLIERAEAALDRDIPRADLSPRAILGIA